MEAVIDIGTNSVRLLAGQKSKNGLLVMEQAAIVTRLGEDVDASGNLSDAAMERTIKVILDYKQRTILQGITPLVVGTSAVRDAQNRQVFIDKVYEATGWQVKVLSGHEEAVFSLKGALAMVQQKQSQQQIAGPVVVIDIGGGSTELFAARQNGVLLKGASLQIGVVRMTERYISQHPVPKTELTALEQNLSCQISPLVDQLVSFQPRTLVAVGGTATTLAAMQLQLDTYSPEKVTGLRIKLSDLEHTYHRLAGYSLVERVGIPGLQQGREDVIVAGLAILKQIIRLFKFDEVMVSDGDLLQGIILK